MRLLNRHAQERSLVVRVIKVALFMTMLVFGLALPINLLGSIGLIPEVKKVASIAYLTGGINQSEAAMDKRS